MSDFYWSEIDLIIFDADGTLRKRKDDRDGPPLSHKDWELIPGIEEAIDEIKRYPIVFGIASNQQCVARKEVPHHQAEQMLRVLADQLDFKLSPQYHSVIMCPHLSDTCACRKPQPGMLFSIMMYWEVHPTRTVMVGDRLVDKQAADRAGCHYLPIEVFLDLGKE